MKINLIIFFLLITGCSSQKKIKIEHSQLRKECALASKKYKGNLPSQFVEVGCLDGNERDFGIIDADIIHAVAVAVFYEKRLERRAFAMNLIEKYDCKTQLECSEFHHLLDWGIKSGHPRRYSKKLAVRANILRDKTLKKLNSIQNY